MKRLLTLFLTATLLLSIGCGSGDRERGKNSQLDRPKPASSGKE